MRIASLVVAALVVAVTALPIVRHQAWWIRVCDFPRPTFTALGALALVGLALSRRPGEPLDAVALAVLSGALLVQLARMLPYTRLWPKEVHDARADHPERTLRVLVTNVLQRNREGQAWRDMVSGSGADCVVALEVDAWWAEQAATLEALYPHAVSVPQDNTYGMLLLSRLRLIDFEVRYLVEPDIPSIHATLSLPSGEHVRLSCMHPRPPAPQEDTDTIERDAELLVLGREVVDSPRPVVVAGDMNDVAWSETTRHFQKMSGLLDPRRGRRMLNTYHAANPLVRFPLDHVFHSPHFRLAGLARLPRCGSDHFAVLVTLSLESDAHLLHEPPEPDATDERRAREKIERARDAQQRRGGQPAGAAL